MPHDPYKSLYLHIPFCASRCSYCDFTTDAFDFDSPAIDEYVEDLCLQIRRNAKEGELDGIETVYIGGGTPSYIGPKRLTMLLYALSTSMRLDPDVECTMEANPESLTENMVRDIWALGVNRISIGVQSFDDRLLRAIGRIHDADDARRAIAAAAGRFDDVGIDLMCGLPDQSLEDFAASLDEAVRLGVKHVSVYPLTIEESSQFARMVARGQINAPDDDSEADMMSLAADVLGAAGFERYEVASYAQPGYECRHNISYWTGVPYLGLGLSAVTMTQNDERRMRVQDGEVLDDLMPPQMAAEDLMLGMRMTRGVGDEAVAQAEELIPDVQDAFADLEQQGLVVHEDGRWKPTERGWLCGNDLYEVIYDLAP